MTAQSFLQKIEGLLRKLPQNERKDILSDYEEHIRTAMEMGKTEDQAIRALGDPKAIAKSIMAEYYIGLADAKKSPESVFRAIMASISLGFFNLLIVLPPSIVFFAAFIVLFVVSLALILSPLIAVYCLIEGYGISVIFASLLTFGLGLFLFSISSWIFKRGFSQWFVKYLKLNIRIARGGV